MFIPRYQMEFVLHGHSLTASKIKNALSEFGDSLEVSECEDPITSGNNFKVCVISEDPTVVFDICAQFGRIKTVKVHEME
jgi:dihydroxyacetone kinase-like predicted kinase